MRFLKIRQSNSRWRDGRDGGWRDDIGGFNTKLMVKIRTHKDLDVYRLSFKTGMEIFELSKNFPMEEKYALTNQIRRASRSVSGNIAEAWRHRRYSKSFVSKLSISEGEAAETQVWLDYALACAYINNDVYTDLYSKYNNIIGKIVNMIRKPENFLL